MYCFNLFVCISVYIFCNIGLSHLSTEHYIERFSSILNSIDPIRYKPFLHLSRFNFSRECVRIISSFTYFVPRCSLPSHCGHAYVEKSIDISFFTSLYVCHGFFIPVTSPDSHLEVLPAISLGPYLDSDTCLINPLSMLDYNFILMKFHDQYAIIPRLCELYYDVVQTTVKAWFFDVTFTSRPFSYNFTDDHHVTFTYHILTHPKFCEFEMKPLDEFLSDFRETFRYPVHALCRDTPHKTFNLTKLIPYASGPQSYLRFNSLNTTLPVRLCLSPTSRDRPRYLPGLCRIWHKAWDTYHSHIKFQNRYVTFFEGLIDYFVYLIVKLLKFFFLNLLTPIFDYLVLSFRGFVPIIISNLSLLLNVLLVSKYFILFLIFLYIYFITKNFIFSLSLVIFVPIILIEYVDLN